MNRQEKEQVISLVKNQFSQNPAFFVVEYKGMTVNQLQDLRKQLREQGGTLQVAKARLMRKALDDLSEKQSLVPYLKEQIGLVFGSEVSGLAKVLRDFSKENEALKLVVGQLDAELLNKENIIRIATLPSKEVLLAQLCGALKAPTTNFVLVLKMQLMRLLMVLKQIEQKKQ